MLVSIVALVTAITAISAKRATTIDPLKMLALVATFISHSSLLRCWTRSCQRPLYRDVRKEDGEPFLKITQQWYGNLPHQAVGTGRSTQSEEMPPLTEIHGGYNLRP